MKRQHIKGGYISVRQLPPRFEWVESEYEITLGHIPKTQGLPITKGLSRGQLECLYRTIGELLKEGSTDE